MKHYAFPSIEQYRNVIRTVKDRCEFHGIPLPKLMFHGTVKLHGTNAGVVINENGGMHCQSRTGIITPEADNAGFANYVHSENGVKEFLTRYAVMARANYFSRDWVTPFKCLVAIYGEWCGGNIQKGVALNQLPKMFVIFAVKLISLPEDDEGQRHVWLMPWDVESIYDATAVSEGTVVKCIEKYPTYQLTIDFAEPSVAQNKLVELTTAVEARCPVGAAHNVTGVGEGIVWTCVGADTGKTGDQPSGLGAFRVSDLVFKVKGEKHSDTKVKTVAPVDIERLNSIRELAEAVATDHRLEKGVAFLQETLGREDVYDVKNLGAFLKWVGGDVVKEETDTIEGNGFEVREVTKAVNDIAKAWFFEKL